MRRFVPLTASTILLTVLLLTAFAGPSSARPAKTDSTTAKGKTSTTLAPTTTAPSADTADPAPSGPCAAPALRIVPVATGAALQSALTGARPGDRIELADGVYSGRFTIRTSGLATARISVCGSRAAILDAGSTTSGYGLALKNASFWDLVGFTVRNAQKGVMLDGSSFVDLDGLEVHTIGDEAVHFRTHSVNNRIANSVIHDTGLREPLFGEGVYVGSANNNWCTYTACLPDTSDLNVIERNRFFNITAEAIDLKEGSTGGFVRDNSFDGSLSVALAWVDIKGNGYTVTGNTGQIAARDGFLTSTALSGWGIGNVFGANTADVQGPGYGFNVRPDNVVLCDNTVTAAAKGFANILCSS